MKPNDPITSLKGCGPKKAEALKKLNIEKLEDLIYLFPRTYEDRRHLTKIEDLEANAQVSIVGKVTRIVQNYYTRGRKQSLRLHVADETGATQILFFNARYLARYFTEGEDYAFFGKVSSGRYGLQLVHPDFCRAEDREEGIIPIYPLTSGVSQKDIRGWQKQIRSIYAVFGGSGEGLIIDPYTEDFRRRNELMDLAKAIDTMHFPLDRESYLLARYRLIFDELFMLQTGLMAVRKRTGIKRGIAFAKDGSEKEFEGRLPFPLTGAQKRCMDEITADLESEKVMNRLVQGDVGSGKTALAQIAMYKAVKSGYQAVMMAPTEILARQHFGSMEEVFEPLGIRVGFLSSGLKATERREVLEKLKSGEIDVLTGTHAVIQPDVGFKNLGLVITDEQHRFGVDQRVRLREKGMDPNILVMTATPIPRTLAVVLYGDLDVSIIDEMPPGRKSVITETLSRGRRERCYDLVEKELEDGRQAYVVTPLIDESEALDVRSAQEVYEELSERFDGDHGHGRYSVALLHGSMKQDEKDSIMEDFAAGGIDLLVATVVIEVGINVPNATVMVIENAERFGLAQMHQLRGRVGRGADQSYCYLILDGGSEISEDRCRIMESSSDGFYIAEEDLKLRGPGDIFGTRQHGLPMLSMADLVRHGKILEHARDEALALLEEDPDLSKPEHNALKEKLTEMFGEGFSLDL